MPNLEQKLNEERIGFFGKLKRKILPYFLGATLGLTGIVGCDDNREVTPPVPPVNVSCNKIAFYSNRDGNGEIYVMNADGTNQTRLTGLKSTSGGAAWSPDGSKIVFHSWGNGYEIYKINVDGSGLEILTNNMGYFDCSPSWSSNGKIAFDSDRDGICEDPNYREIYTMNADGTSPTRLTNNSAGDHYPRWSPDGKIAFYSHRDGNGEIYVMNADGSLQTNLTNNPAGDFDPAWSPDGTKIAFDSDRDGNGEIYVMNADGSGQTNLTNNPSYEERFPSWSPDGTKIAFDSDRDGNHEIYVMNADGSGQTRLTNNSYFDREPSWSPTKE